MLKPRLSTRWTWLSSNSDHVHWAGLSYVAWSAVSSPVAAPRWMSYSVAPILYSFLARSTFLVFWQLCAASSIYFMHMLHDSRYVVYIIDLSWGRPLLSCFLSQTFLFFNSLLQTYCAHHLFYFKNLDYQLSLVTVLRLDSLCFLNCKQINNGNYYRALKVPLWSVTILVGRRLGNAQPLYTNPIGATNCQLYSHRSALANVWVGRDELQRWS